MLLSKGANVHACNKNFATPLHAAADQGHLAIVKLLIQHKANVDAQTLRGDTPLHLAAYRGHSDVMRALVTSGADASLLNNHQVTAETEARTARHTEAADYLRSVATEQNSYIYSDESLEHPMLRLEPPPVSSYEPSPHSSYTSRVTHHHIPASPRVTHHHTPASPNSQSPHHYNLPTHFNTLNNPSFDRSSPYSLNVTNPISSYNVTNSFGEIYPEDSSDFYSQTHCKMLSSNTDTHRSRYNDYDPRHDHHLPTTNNSTSHYPSPPTYEQHINPTSHNYSCSGQSPSCLCTVTNLNISGFTFPENNPQPGFCNLPLTPEEEPSSFVVENAQCKISNKDADGSSRYLGEYNHIHNVHDGSLYSLPVSLDHPSSVSSMFSSRGQASLGSHSNSSGASLMSIDTNSSINSFTSHNSSLNDVPFEKTNTFPESKLSNVPQQLYEDPKCINYRRAISVQQRSTSLDYDIGRRRPSYTKSVSLEREQDYSYTMYQPSNNLSISSQNCLSSAGSAKSSPSMTCINIPLN